MEENIKIKQNNLPVIILIILDLLFLALYWYAENVVYFWANNVSYLKDPINPLVRNFFNTISPLIFIIIPIITTISIVYAVKLAKKLTKIDNNKNRILSVILFLILSTISIFLLKNIIYQLVTILSLTNYH